METEFGQKEVAQKMCTLFSAKIFQLGIGKKERENEEMSIVIFIRMRNSLSLLHFFRERTCLFLRGWNGFQSEFQMNCQVWLVFCLPSRKKIQKVSIFFCHSISFLHFLLRSSLQLNLVLTFRKYLFKINFFFYFIRNYA